GGRRGVTGAGELEGGEIAPEIAQDARRRVFPLTWMPRGGAPALALGFDETADLARRHRDREAARRGGQERLGAIVEAVRQLDEPVADERRLTDQEVLRRWMERVPGGERAEPCRFPDDRVRDSVHLRVATAGLARLEGRPRHVPLEEVYEPSDARGDVDELVPEEALARARQAGHEDHSPIGQATQLLGEALQPTRPHPKKSWPAGQ